MINVAIRKIVFVIAIAVEMLIQIINIEITKTKKIVGIGVILEMERKLAGNESIALIPQLHQNESLTH